MRLPSQVIDAVWKIPEGAETLFVGPVFSDGSSMHNDTLFSCRCTWGLVEVSAWELPAVPVKHVTGHLPVMLQDINGAELYAALFWLRHLDPITIVPHVLHTDSQWVASGFDNIAHMLDPWTPHRGLWEAVKTAMDELPLQLSVSVRKVRAHATILSTGHNPKLAWERLGNNLADNLAKQRCRHEWFEPALKARYDKSMKLSMVLLCYHARLLSWAIKRDFLPPRPASVGRAGPRVLLMPVHAVAVDSTGTGRCVRCLRLQGECRAEQNGGCIGKRVRDHQLHYLGDGIFCRVCGAYSFRRTLKLVGSCSGRPTGAVKYRLRAMQRGLHPVERRWLGAPRCIEDVALDFAVFL